MISPKVMTRFAMVILLLLGDGSLFCCADGGDERLCRLRDLLKSPVGDPLPVCQIAAHTKTDGASLQELSGVFLIDAAHGHDAHMADGAAHGLEICRAKRCGGEELDKVRARGVRRKNFRRQ